MRLAVAFACLWILAAGLAQADWRDDINSKLEELDRQRLDAQQRALNNAAEVDRQRLEAQRRAEEAARQAAGAATAPVRQLGEQVKNSGDLGRIAVNAFEATGRVWESVRTGTAPNLKDMVQVLVPAWAIPIEATTELLRSIGQLFKGPKEFFDSLPRDLSAFFGPLVVLVWAGVAFVCVKILRAAFARDKRRPVAAT